MVQIRYDRGREKFHCTDCHGVDYCECLDEQGDPICECGELGWSCQCDSLFQEFLEWNGIEDEDPSENMMDAFTEWLTERLPHVTIIGDCPIQPE